MPRKAWSIYLVLGLAVSGVYFVVPPGLPHHALYDALGLSSVVAIVYGVRRYRPASAKTWYLFALGQLLFVMGDLARAFYETVLEVETPLPSVADGFYLMAYGFLTAGLLLLIRSRDPGRDSASLIDAAIIVTAAGVVSWVFIIEPYASDPALSWMQIAISVAYPLMDLLMLAFAARLAVGPGARSRSYYLLLASLSGLLLADCGLLVTQLDGTYHTGSFVDSGFLLSYVLWGAAALHPSMRRLSEPAEFELKLTRRRLALLAAASLTAPALRILETVRGHDPDIVVTVGGTVVLFSLVLTRMSGLVQMLSTALARHREAEVARRESEERFRSLVQNSSDVVTVIDPNGIITYQSPSVGRVLGYGHEDLLGSELVQLVHPDDAKRFVTLADEVIHQQVPAPVRAEYRQRHRDGAWRDVETSMTNLLADPTVQGIVLNTRDVTERTALQAQLEHQAFHDPLTGLANRALFRDRVEHALERTLRPNEPLAVLFLDVDDFKTINDSLGHSAGDRLLLQLTERIRSCLRTGDTPARLGGDEFAILLEDTADAESVAARISESLQPPFTINETDLTVTASVGICLGGLGHGGADELLRNADAAMYTAKSRGKARHEIFNPDMHAAALKRLELEAELRRAIEQKQFRLHYQPLVEVQTGSIMGLEALIRWKHPERGLLGPAEFIALAEETGLIVPVGQWVLEEGCRQAMLWQVRYSSERPLTMAVNLSSNQLASPRFVRTVSDTLRTSGLAPQSLTLEMTERVIMRDTEATIARLRELKTLGVRIAIDDFGTGFSSLGYLQRFPIDSLKIAKPFLDNIPGDEQAAALVRGIVELGRTLELEVVAEGIERDEQWQCLRQMRCELVQGFHFARPQGSERIELLLQQAQASGSWLSQERTGPPAPVGALGLGVAPAR